MGLLGNKTRLMAAHQEEHLKEADQGKLLGKGKFSELQERRILNGSTSTPFHNDPKELKSDNGNIEKSKKGEDGMVQLASRGLLLLAKYIVLP